MWHVRPPLVDKLDKKTIEETEQKDLLLLSHQRDLQIGWPVFRFVKSTTVNVFASIKQHAVVDVNEVVVHINLSLGQD